MICQVCGKNVASIHLQKVVNGKRSDIYLCNACARTLQNSKNANFMHKNTEGAGFMPFFESKFTDKAESVIKKANEMALEWGHGYVGTEHILYGLAVVDNSVAYNVLKQYELTPENILDKIKKIRGRRILQNV